MVWAGLPRHVSTVFSWIYSPFSPQPVSLDPYRDLTDVSPRRKKGKGAAYKGDRILHISLLPEPPLPQPPHPVSLLPYPFCILPWLTCSGGCPAILQWSWNPAVHTPPAAFLPTPWQCTTQHATWVPFTAILQQSSLEECTFCWRCGPIGLAC